MTKATFLHISDFHFKNDILADSDDVFNEFLNDIKQWRESHDNQKIDLIFITGDIAFSGKREEYAIAYDKIKKIIKRAGCQEKDIFLVPGNHDVNYDEIILAEQSLKKAIMDNKYNVNNLLSNYKSYKIFLDKFKFYLEFIKLFGNPDTLWEEDDETKPWYSKERTINNIEFHIIGLTSSLFTNQDYNNRNEIYLGIRQLQEALMSVNDDNFIIVLSHYPLDWLNEYEKEKSEVLIAKKDFLIYLHGHIHKHKKMSSVYSLSMDIGYLSLGVGCLYGGSDHPNSYHILQIDQEKNNIRIWPKKWSSSAKWVPDNDWEDLDSDKSYVCKIKNNPFSLGKTHKITEKIEFPKTKDERKKTYGELYGIKLFEDSINN